MANDVKWIKIVTDIFDDEKILMIESMPSADSIIVIWFKLLTLAGKQNNNGVFLMANRIAYTDEMLAAIFRRDINTVRMALGLFEQFGMIEIVDKVITIPNWNKHQTLDSYEKRKERDRIYQAQRRIQQKALIEKSADESTDAMAEQSPFVCVSDKDKDIEPTLVESNNPPENNKSSEVLSEPAARTPPEKGKKPAKVFEHDGNAWKGAAYLSGKIRERLPDIKPADEAELQRWASDIDKINRLDGYDWKLISKALRFSQTDDFWQKNVLSGAKFRKQFVTLLAQMSGDEKKPDGKTASGNAGWGAKPVYLSDIVEYPPGSGRFMSKSEVPTDGE